MKVPGSAIPHPDPGTYLGGSHGSYGSPLWVDSIVFSRHIGPHVDAI